MAYCPHCAFIMPTPGTKISCPNCGRKKVKLSLSKPAFYSSATAFETRETSKGALLSSLGAGILTTLCSLIFLIVGIMFRSPLSIFWWGLGITAGCFAYCFFRDFTRGLKVDRNPEKGYLDHLHDLAESRSALVSKISQLETLLKRQRPGDSDRAKNRSKLVSAAVNNRKKKLALIDEAEFVIHAKQRISRIEALAQDLSKNTKLRETERRIEKAFTEIKEWMSTCPHHYQSAAGRKVRHSMEQAMALHSDIMEQIEDRLVMRALNDESNSDEAFALDQVYSFLEKSEIQIELGDLDIEEVIAADEEYIKINTELRLLKDGIKHDIAKDPLIDFDSDIEESDYPSGLS